MTLSLAECRLYDPQKLAEIGLESNDNLTKALAEHLIERGDLEMQIGDVECAIHEAKKEVEERLGHVLWLLDENPSEIEIDEDAEAIQEKLDEALKCLMTLANPCC